MLFYDQEKRVSHLKSRDLDLGRLTLNRNHSRIAVFLGVGGLNFQKSCQGQRTAYLALSSQRRYSLNDLYFSEFLFLQCKPLALSEVVL